MITTVLIIAMLFSGSFQTLFCKLFSDKYEGDGTLSSSVFSIFQALGLAFLTFCLNGFKARFSVFTVVMGFLSAIMLFVYNSSLIQAGKRGSFAFFNVMLLLGGIMIPMLHECIFLGEQIKVYQFAAIGFVLVAMVLMNIESISLGGTKLSYYIFCLLLFLTNGLYGTFLNIQTEYKGDQSKEMLITSYLFLGVLAFADLALKQKKDTFRAFKMKPVTWLFMAVAIFSAGTAANLVMILLKTVSSSVLFSVQTGGILVLSSLYGVFIFKEKMSPLKVIGLAVSIISITILCI